jgi:hypothetical protein
MGHYCNEKHRIPLETSEDVSLGVNKRGSKCMIIYLHQNARYNRYMNISN